MKMIWKGNRMLLNSSRVKEDKLGRAGNVLLGKINEYLKFWVKFFLEDMVVRNGSTEISGNGK